MTRSLDNTDDRYGNDGHELSPCVCSNCGHWLDAGSDIEVPGYRPKPGDVSVCVKCGHLHLYADDLSLRAPTLDELSELLANADVLRAWRMLKDPLGEDHA